MTWVRFLELVTGLSSGSRFMELIAHRRREDANTITDPGQASAAIRGALRG